VGPDLDTHEEPGQQGWPSLGGPELSLLLKQVACLVMRLDAELRIQQAVGSGGDAGWFSEPAAPGTTVSDLIGGDDGDRLLLACREALKGHSSAFLYERGEHCFDARLEPLRTEHNGHAIAGCLAVLVEVTRQKRAEDSVRRSEERLAEAQHIAHVGSWEWDVATNRVHWSNELHRIYGLSPGEFGGTYEDFIERVLPEDREQTRATVFAAYRSMQPFIYDHRVVRPDGSVRMLHTRGVVLADAHGKVRCLTGACWDTTELWETTRQLERSLSLLRATLESTADGLLVVDRAGQVSAYNQRLLELWRLSREAMDHRDFDSLLALVHDQLENGDACLRRVRELAGTPDAESFDSLRFRDGRFFERYSRPQRLGTEVVGRVWSYREVTEREQLLRRTLFLSDASRLLASLEVEKALEAVAHLALPFMGDACAVDLFTDGEPRRLLVISRDPVRTIGAELQPSTLRGQAAIYAVGPDSFLTVPLMGQGEMLGALTFAAASGRRYNDADLALASELARRTELALQNGRLYRKAQDALAARDEFLSVAAHELRGPVTSLHLAVQGLQRSPAAPVQRLLGIIEREDRRIAHFVDDLLDLARIRSGQLRFVFGSVDLVEVVHEASARLTVELSRSGSALSLTAPGTLVGTWDRARLVQVVTNLLGNAIKFGLGKPIEVTVDSDGNRAHLTVIDHGIGIPAELQKQVFEPFERAVSSRHYGGLGLGLYVVRTATLGMGGEVRLESHPAEGTRVTVELPISRSA
jgi:PAS domain S-box-containing protein